MSGAPAPDRIASGRGPVTVVPGVRPATVAALGALVVLVAVSFASLHVSLAPLAEPGAGRLALDFLAGFAPPELGAAFLGRIGTAVLETIAMSAVGTLTAAGLALLLAGPAAAAGSGDAAVVGRSVIRPVFAMLRAVPELVWAALFVIVAGLGPFSGTMALALHTTGVLGRLFAEAVENLPRQPADALRASGAGSGAVYLYATLPQALPQFVSYALYRWENNIRAAAVLGVVGAGGLGQMLLVTLSLFQMQRVATVIVAIVALVAVVDAISALLRRSL